MKRLWLMALPALAITGVVTGCDGSHARTTSEEKGDEARVIIEDWRIDDNTNRPHTAHGDQTPAEFAAAWTTINEPKVA